MSRQSPTLPDLSVQEADINAQLNATVLGIFMMGMYTIVYFGTMYICITAKISQGKFVLTTISLLFIFGIIESSFEWTFLQWFFLQNGATRQSVFISLLQLPRWTHVMNNLFAFGMLALADGLLLWRCFNIWGRSPKVVFLPLILYVGEIGLFTSAIITLFVVHARPTHHQALTVDRIESAGYFVSATTSLLATLLIAFRISSLAKGSLSELQGKGMGRGKGRFRHIIEIIVQSVAVYSLALFVQAIAVVIPFKIGSKGLFTLEGYSAAILIPITGIAPTIMVARVTLSANESEDDSTWPKTRQMVSTNIRFRSDNSASVNQSDTRVPVIGDDDDAKREA